MKLNKNNILILAGLILLIFACASCGGGRDIPSNMHPEPVHSMN